MNEITIKQNLPEQIDKLSAQRYLYSRSKKFFYVRIFLSLIFAIIIPLLANRLQSQWYYVALVATLYLVIDIFILERCEELFKKNAAKIQESFDVEVFSLPWNDIVVGNKVDEEEVLKYSELYKKRNSVDDLMNWYSQDISKLDILPAVAVCQRTNIYWDISLRKKIFWALIIILIISVFVIFALSKNPILVIFSVIPFCRVVAEYCISNHKTIKKIENLKSKIENGFNNLIQLNKINYLRTVQDEIFRHRESSAFVPDCFYKLNRDKQEKEMNYSAKHYVDQILKGQN